jgi:hypothetical protein
VRREELGGERRGEEYSVFICVCRAVSQEDKRIISEEEVKKKKAHY